MSIISGFKSYERYIKTDTGYQKTSERTLAKDVLLGDGSGNSVETEITNLNNKLSNVFKAKVTGTLTAGQTSIKLTDNAITTDSKFDFYTSIYGVSPTNVAVAAGSITLTFDAQETNMNVEVRVM